jgi:hypothetical protein
MIKVVDLCQNSVKIPFVEEVDYINSIVRRKIKSSMIDFI